MSAPELTARLFAARTAAHFAHLTATGPGSYARHVVLEAFYDEVVDKADHFTEAYQGLFGVIKNYPDVKIPSGDPMTWIADLNKWVRSNRETASKGKTELANIIDDILALLDTTYYKLKNLK